MLLFLLIRMPCAFKALARLVIEWAFCTGIFFFNGIVYNRLLCHCLPQGHLQVAYLVVYLVTIQL